MLWVASAWPDCLLDQRFLARLDRALRQPADGPGDESFRMTIVWHAVERSRDSSARVAPEPPRIHFSLSPSRPGQSSLDILPEVHLFRPRPGITFRPIANQTPAR